MRTGSSGTGVIQLVGVTLISLMVSSLGVDFAWYFAAQNQLQTAAESSALSAAYKLFKSKAPSPAQRQQEAVRAAQTMTTENLPGELNGALDTDDVTFGFVDPATRKVNSSTFTTPTQSPGFAHTGGYNAVKVSLHRDNGHTGGQLPTVFAQLFNVNGLDAEAHAIAMADNHIEKVVSGVRPIYSCEAQWLRSKQNLDAGTQPPNVRIYSDRFQTQESGRWTASPNCPTPGAGNWGFADLRNCTSNSVGACTIADWFWNGYPGPVSVGTCYSTKPGNFLSAGDVSRALDSLISNKTEVLIPVVPLNQFRGSGSNTNVLPSAFVGFVFTNYRATGSESSRYVEGYYTRTVCSTGQCVSAETADEGGVSTVRLVR